MITETTGIRTIETLYVQLLYRCQFRCTHCFHGDRLTWRDAYSFDQAVSLITLMRRNYSTNTVCFLGGEPFMYSKLGELLRYTKRELAMRTEICTNGYRIARKLSEFGHDIDFLRISLEGLESANDAIRHPGSFVQALAAFAHARRLGITTGATMTVTATNIDDVAPLAHQLQDLDVTELKLHHLRPVGYAAARPELLITDTSTYDKMRKAIAEAGLTMTVIADEALTDEHEEAHAEGYGATVRRIEADPRGHLTMSCNAVGTDGHAFSFDKQNGRIELHQSERSEIMLGIPPVVYSRA